MLVHYNFRKRKTFGEFLSNEKNGGRNKLIRQKKICKKNVRKKIDRKEERERSGRE